MSEPRFSVDDTTRRLVVMLSEKLDSEPEPPDLDRHIGSHLEVVARTYSEWQRSVSGLRALVGVRLTTCALDALKEQA